MKKIVIYTTDIHKTDNVLKHFYNGFKKQSKWIPYLLNIKEYLKFGFPKGIDAIAVFGILRGTGKALLEAKNKNIDSFYFDHAYFDSGYKENHWVRLCKNLHTMNYLKNVTPKRWFQNFNEKYKIKPWLHNFDKKKNILIIPPTSAISWYFSCHNWLDQTLTFLKQRLNKDIFSNIRIRVKPKEPIVDINGNFLGLKETNVVNQVQLQDDLDDARLVIAFNSQVALEATIQGIPIIVNEHNACNSISFSFDNIKDNLKNEVFLKEPKRTKLFNWLACNQFNLSELENGYAWNEIIK